MAAIGVLALCLACTGCSVSISAGTFSARTPGPAPSGDTHAVGHARRGSLPPLHQRPPVGYAPATPAPGLSPEGRSFVNGVDAFCHSWYVDQKAALIRYPWDSQDRQFYALEAVDSQRLDRRLNALKPPQALASTYTAFVSNEGRIATDRREEASDDPETRASGDQSYDRDLAQRHADAKLLGAAQCDALLPRGQWTAAVRAVQRWDLSGSTAEVCGGLVTPQFLHTMWGDVAGSPRAICRSHAQAHVAEGLPRNIHAISVTGTEDLDAEVTFRQVPDCGCGQATIRLFYEHGRWLVASVW